EFCAKHPARHPRKEPENPSELRLLTEPEGVFRLGSPPAESETRASPATSSDVRHGRHLWVFFDVAVPYVLEAAPRANPALTSGIAKHTNLTAGAPAECGGELWVDPATANLIYVNGASGRYGPETPEELNDAVAVFRSKGFEVVSFDWDDDAGKPARVLRQ
ncbi:MAG: hypothetical protein ACYC8T_31870, partial [Myxococcaceae bacterium]